MASPNPLPALQALKASKAGFNFRVGNKVQNWFDFINGKAHVLSVLDGSGVFSWPGGSLLDVGCGHGFLDAFVMGRYVKVVGIELGRSYQCSEIMASPLTSTFMTAVALR
jgi:2-polyprenyl-3-methyl-5-hydroxy-6-metoxy-1,4-benzoquinol methylase